MTMAGSLWKNIFKSSREKDAETRDILRGIPIFEGLSRRELAAIENILHKRQYRSGETIFRQGEPAVGMYMIVEGRVMIVSEPGPHELAELKDGDFFGELALLDDSPRSATAVADGPCRLLGFFQPDLFALADRNPKLGFRIVTHLARIMGQRLRKSNEDYWAIQKELADLTESEEGPDKENGEDDMGGGGQ